MSLPELEEQLKSGRSVANDYVKGFIAQNKERLAAELQGFLVAKLGATTELSA